MERSSFLEHPLPHSAEAERAVLGAILLENTLLRQSANLAVTDFYIPSFGRIFAAMLALDEDGQPIDPIMLAEQLRRDGWLDSVGGVTAISNLTYGLPYQANIWHYVREIKAYAARRRAVKRLGALHSTALDPDVSLKDLCVSLSALESELRNEFSEQTESFRPLREIFDAEVLPTLQAYFRQEMTEFLLPTGFPEIDEILGGGLYLSDMMAVVAPPKSAKSAFALQLALSLAANGSAVGLLSLEMSNLQNGLRFIVQQSYQASVRNTGGINDALEANWLRPGMYESTYRRAISTATELAGAANLYLCQKPLTWREVQAETRRLVKEKQLRVLVVDYWQLVVNDRRSQTRAESLAEIAKGLKQLGQELNMCVIALGQFNQEGLRLHAGGKELNTMYLEGSGELVKSANIVLTLDIEPADLHDRTAPRQGKLIFRPLRSAADAQLNCYFFGKYLTVEIQG